MNCSVSRETDGFFGWFVHMHRGHSEGCRRCCRMATSGARRPKTSLSRCIAAPMDGLQSQMAALCPKYLFGFWGFSFKSKLSEIERGKVSWGDQGLIGNFCWPHRRLCARWQGLGKLEPKPGFFHFKSKTKKSEKGAAVDGRRRPR